MSRSTHGRNTVTKVFRKSAEIIDRNPSLWRADRYGRVMARAAYGDRNSQFGWDIHHRDSNHNNNNINNLEAVHFSTHEEIHS